MNDYEQLTSKLREISVLSSVNGLLTWDSEVLMPKADSEFRSEQKALLAKLSHEWFIDDKLGELLVKISKDKNLTEEQKLVVSETLEDYQRAKKIPTSLVEEYEKATSKSFIAWENAKKKNDFKSFLPHLQIVIELNKKMASLTYPGMNTYQALLKSYDRDLELKKISDLLSQVREEIIPIIKKAKKQNTKILSLKIPKYKQIEYNRYFATRLGLDFDHARIDESTHPFTMDNRITTRYDHGWWGAISSTTHEVGHALYELGLDKKHFGTPLGSSVSMSFHESQSRIWENQVGKSKAFWKKEFAMLKKSYSPALDKLTLEEFYKAINDSRPSLIRVEADELTYPLHVILRFEIEQEIFAGKINAKDIPKIWNDKMKKYLGITAPNDSLGCLQDVHWSQGYFGYFPTYIIGSIISAQLYNAAKKQIPNLEKEFEKGNTKLLLDWLRKNIHQHGRRYKTEELIKRATGKELSADDYIEYLREKFTNL